MMPRSVWSGALSFGLVNVPVKLYSAQSPKDVRFHQLHAPDGGRVQQRRVCSLDGQEVPYEEVAKGYEVAPDEHVLVTKEELEALDPEASRSIGIRDFVDQTDIDPVYYDRAYWLVPDKGAAKSYALLREAMQRSGKVAIATLVMRGKEYLAAVRTAGDALVLSTMLHADEVVPAGSIEGIPAKGKDIDERELALAQQLVDALAGPFEPERYPDEHRARVLELVERKARGETITAPAPAKASPRTRDLAAALEASLAAARSKRGEVEAATPSS